MVINAILFPPKSIAKIKTTADISINFWIHKFINERFFRDDDLLYYSHFYFRFFFKSKL